MLSLKEEVEQLKKEKNAVILAHYYVPDDVQEVADYIGDSFYLSKIAKNIDTDLIVFAGVSFMGESAKILNPKKKVLLPDRYADCAMAHMASVDRVKKMRDPPCDNDSCETTNSVIPAALRLFQGCTICVDTLHYLCRMCAERPLLKGIFYS